MEAFFRSVAIGLGVLMGTFSPGVQPDLQLSVHKGEGQLYVSGVVLRAVSSRMLEALDEGVVILLVLQPALDGRASPPATRSLAYQAVSREWLVSGPGDARRSFFSRDAAVEAWVTWPDVVVGAAPSAAFTVSAEVNLTFPGRPEWKSDLVWAAPAVWTKSFSRLSEVPF